MSNLVPEKRQDKNGKIVTRHVRNAGTVPGTHRIPAPQNSRSMSDEEALIVLADPQDKIAFAEAVKKTSPDAVTGMVDFLKTRNGKITRELADHAVNLVTHKSKNTQRYIEVLKENYDYASSVDSGDSIALVNGILDVEDRVIKHSLNVDQRQALITVTKAVSQSPDFDPMTDIEYRLRNNMYHYVMMNEELIRFTVDNPDRKDEIAAAVASGLTRPGEIKAVLDDDIQRPLLNGAL